MKIGYADEFVSLKTDKASDKSFSVYPNPSNGLVHVRANGTGRQTNYEIYDMTGKPVQTGVVKNLDNVIGLNLAKGMYFIRLHTDKGVETHKLIIQK